MEYINPKLRSIRILIVDDQQFIRTTLKQMLFGLGCSNIYEADSGEEALIVLSDIPIDLVISDIDMAPINGLELLKAIRTGEKSIASELPVIMLTSKSFENIVYTAMALDVNAFVIKPATQGIIKEKVERTMFRLNPMRAAGVYKVIPIPSLGGGDQESTLDNSKKDPEPIAELEEEENEDSVVSIPIEQLEPDLELVRNIVSNGGVVLVKSGTKLTKPILDKIRDVREMIGGYSVWVKR